jgi:hypothetical protein
MSPRACFYLHHSKPIQGESRLWKIQNTYNNDGSLSRVACSEVKSVGTNWTDFTVNAEYNVSKSTKLLNRDSLNGIKPIFNAILK